MRRPLIRLLEAVAVFVSIATILVGLVIWRLSSAPLSLDPVKDWLVDALLDGRAGVTLALGETSVSWGGWRDFFQVRARDAELKGAAGDAVLSVAEVTATLSLGALVTGRLAPLELHLSQPRLALLRDSEGRLAIDRQAGDGTPAPAGNPADVAKAMHFLSVLAAPADRRQTLGHLKKVKVEQGQVTFRDATWRRPMRLTIPDVLAERTPTGLRLDGSARVDLGVPASLLTVAADFDRARRVVDGRIDFAGVAIDRLATWFPGLADIVRVETPVSGRLDVAFDPVETRLARAALTMRTGRGAAVMAGRLPAPITFDTASVQMSYRAAVGRLDVNEVLVTRGDGELAVRGSVEGPRAAQKLRLNGVIRNFAVDDFPEVWPANLAPRTRQWILRNVTAGRLEALSFRIGGTTRDWSPDQILLTERTGELTFSGGVAHYRRPLPPARQLRGAARFSPATMTVDVTEGRLDALRLSDAEMVFSDLDAKTPRAVIATDLSGPVKRFLKVLDQPALDAATAVGLPPENAEGRLTGRLRLAFPMRGDLAFRDMETAFKGDLQDGSLTGVAAGRDLEDAFLKVALRDRALTVRGTGTIQGQAVELEHRRLDAAAPTSVSRLRTTLLPADQRRFGIEMAPFVSGPLPVDLTYTTAAEAPPRLVAALDLARAELRLAALAWRKPANAAGFLRFEAMLPPTGPIHVSNFELAAGDLAAGGKVTLVDGAVSVLDLRRLSLGESNLSVTARRREDGGYAVTIDGERLNLAGVGQSLRKDALETPPIEFVARLDQLDLGFAMPLSAASLRGTWSGKKLERASIVGRMRQGDLRLSMGHGDVTQLTASRIDDFLALFGVESRITGGPLVFFGRGRADGGLSGRLKVSDFTVTEAPILARILSLASFTGIVQALRGGGLRFKVFDAVIDFDRTAIRLSDGFAYGPSLGISIAGALNRGGRSVDLGGSVAPASELSRLIEVFPILGNIITGGRKEGLFAAEYQVRGPLSKPIVTVNPLTAILPGFLRGLVRLGRGAPPPDEDRDEAN